MKRREVIGLIGGAAATWPLAARAQQSAARVYRVGYLTIASREQQLHLIKAFEEGLRSLGYRVGENVVIEYRFADGEIERLPALAGDLVRLGVDLIVTGANPNTIAAMKATTIIPIIMTNSIDPVGTGLVASLARPSGNVTGFAQDTGGEIYGKRLELLKEILPNLSRVGILWNPDFAPNRSRVESIREAAQGMGVMVVSVEARGQDAFEQAFTTMMKERIQGFVISGDAVLFNYRGQIAEMAMRNRLPAASSFKEWAEAGLLLDTELRLKIYFVGLPSSLTKSSRVRSLPTCRDQVRAGDQFEDRKGAWRRSADIAAATRRRGDRIAPMSASGTFRKCRDVRLESAFGGRAEVGFRGRQVCF